MPHATVSDSELTRRCPYCGYPLKERQKVCPAHADLVRLEPLDDRYLLVDDAATADR